MKSSIGLCGATGKTPDLQIGQVKTVEHTQKASVEITGTRETPILNFNIPKGKDGAKLIIKEIFNGDIEILNNIDATPTTSDIKSVISTKGIKEFKKHLETILQVNLDETGILKERVNNLTTIKEGSTTGDAELQDIRVGADGTRFASAGESVRKQIEKLNNLVFTVKKGSNLLQNVIINDNTSLNDKDGTTFNWEGISTSDFIEVDTNTRYTFLNASGAYIGVATVCYYDSNKSFLGIGVTNTNIGYYCYKENQKYIRFSIPTSAVKDIVSLQPYEEKWTYSIDNDKYINNFETVEDIAQKMKNVEQKIIDATKKPDKKPVICFNFDECSLDNRYTALQNVGFTGTWQFTTLEWSTEMLNTLIQNGHDLSPYAGLSEEEYHDTNNFETNIKKLHDKVVQELEDMKKLGIYNPVMFSCSRHRGGYVVTKALEGLPFKYIRCSWGVGQDTKDYYVSEENKPNAREIKPIGLTTFNTIDTIKNKIDDSISRNYSLIMLMCHQMDFDNITEANYFENLVAYVKELQDKGIVKVMNMREYYEYQFPEQGKKDDRTRIISAINDLRKGMK